MHHTLSLMTTVVVTSPGSVAPAASSRRRRRIDRPRCPLSTPARDRLPHHQLSAPTLDPLAPPFALGRGALGAESAQGSAARGGRAILAAVAVRTGEGRLVVGGGSGGSEEGMVEAPPPASLPTRRIRCPRYMPAVAVALPLPRVADPAYPREAPPDPPPANTIAALVLGRRHPLS